jgi:hypothetical protein
MCLLLDFYLIPFLLQYMQGKQGPSAHRSLPIYWPTSVTAAHVTDIPPLQLYHTNADLDCHLQKPPLLPIP